MNGSTQAVNHCGHWWHQEDWRRVAPPTNTRVPCTTATPAKKPVTNCNRIQERIREEGGVAKATRNNKIPSSQWHGPQTFALPPVSSPTFFSQKIVPRSRSMRCNSHKNMTQRRRTINSRMCNKLGSQLDWILILTPSASMAEPRCSSTQ